LIFTSKEKKMTLVTLWKLYMRIVVHVGKWLSLCLIKDFSKCPL